MAICAKQIAARCDFLALVRWSKIVAQRQQRGDTRFIVALVVDQRAGGVYASAHMMPLDDPLRAVFEELGLTIFDKPKDLGEQRRRAAGSLTYAERISLNSDARALSVPSRDDINLAPARSVLAGASVWAAMNSSVAADSFPEPSALLLCGHCLTTWLSARETAEEKWWR